MYRYYYYRHGPGCGDAHFETGWRENRAGRLATMPVERVGDTLLVWTNSHAAVGVVTGTNLRCDWPSGWKYRNVAVRWLARAPVRDVQFDDRFDVWQRATMGEESTDDLQRVARRVAEHVSSIQPATPVARRVAEHVSSIQPATPVARRVAEHVSSIQPATPVAQQPVARRVAEHVSSIQPATPVAQQPAARRVAEHVSSIQPATPQQPVASTRPHLAVCESVAFAAIDACHAGCGASTTLMAPKRRRAVTDARDARKRRRAVTDATFVVPDDCVEYESSDDGPIIHLAVGACADDAGATDTAGSDTEEADATDTACSDADGADATDTAGSDTGEADATDTASSDTGEASATDTAGSDTGEADATDTAGSDTGEADATDTAGSDTGEADATDTAGSDTDSGSDSDADYAPSGDSSGEDSEHGIVWQRRLTDDAAAFLRRQDAELQALDWTFGHATRATLAMPIQLATPGGAGLGRQTLSTSGVLAYTALLEHVACKGGAPTPDLALEFVAHPLTTPQYINETWRVDSLAQLHALVHQLVADAAAYIREHSLHWHALCDPAELARHEGRLFRVNVRRFHGTPTRTLWTGFVLGATWDAVFRRLGFCRTVYSLVRRDGDHAVPSGFVCNECRHAEACTCRAPESHARQRELIEEIMALVVDRPRRGAVGQWHTVPLYVRDAHFFKQYPRALLLHCVCTPDTEERCTMSCFRARVFPRLVRLLNDCPQLKAWFRWTPVTGEEWG
jgi:hypothetical protein